MITISSKSWHYSFIRFANVWVDNWDTCGYLRALMLSFLKVFTYAGGSGLLAFWFTYCTIITCITIDIRGFTFSSELFDLPMEILTGWEFAAIAIYTVILAAISVITIGFLCLAIIVYVCFGASDGVGVIREKVESSSFGKIISAKLNKICVPVQISIDRD